MVNWAIVAMSEWTLQMVWGSRKPDAYWGRWVEKDVRCNHKRCLKAVIVWLGGTYQWAHRRCLKTMLLVYRKADESAVMIREESCWVPKMRWNPLLVGVCVFINRECSEVVDHRLSAAFKGQWQVALGSEWRPNAVTVSRRTLIGREFLSD